ncbi:hypothetical protein Pan241w_16750 [Gimesia alba]|uniref:Uncharacterized protein n=1 Tax=Gimesia alba TaxID=2527973 RepID=A0A517RCJ6_9PLAN|nr:hypothetical protein Pan241w_16750 [Gimesia alba]
MVRDLPPALFRAFNFRAVRGRAKHGFITDLLENCERYGASHRL